MHRYAWLLAVAAAVAVLAALPFFANAYIVGVGLTILMWIALTQSWCVLSQMTGYVSLGHVVFRSLRENEEAAETLGVPIVRYKLLAFVLSAAIPGMVGAVMAMRSTYFVVVQAFDPMVSITVIAMAILGGGDSSRGPLLGVLFLSILSELLWAQAPTLYMIVLGAILVVFVLLIPGGLVGLLEKREKRRRTRPDAPAVFE